MSHPIGFNLRPGISASISSAPIELVQIHRPLRRILDFTSRSIDDVVNDPIAKREVLGFYKLHLQVQRTCEIVELERQWNP